MPPEYQLDFAGATSGKRSQEISSPEDFTSNENMLGFNFTVQLVPVGGYLQHSIAGTSAYTVE
jgi:hypothetical protein